jgi:hypothetical protein
MDKKDFNHSKITKIIPYRIIGGKLLFNLTYELWDDDGNKAELNIPRVESPFYDDIDKIDLHRDWKTEVELRDINDTLIYPGRCWAEYTADIKTRDKVEIYAGYDSKESSNHDSFYSIKNIKKKMTIDDIEKALGYKVEIVNKNKED